MDAPLRRAARARGEERARPRGGEPADGAPAAPAPRARALEAGQAPRVGVLLPAAWLIAPSSSRAAPGPRRPRGGAGAAARALRQRPGLRAAGRGRHAVRRRLVHRGRDSRRAARARRAATAASCARSRLQRRGSSSKSRALAVATGPAAGTRAGRSSASTGGSAAGSCTCCADGSVDPDVPRRALGTVTALARHGHQLWVGGRATPGGRCDDRRARCPPSPDGTGARPRRGRRSAVRRRPVRADRARRRRPASGLRGRRRSPARSYDIDVHDGVVHAAGALGARGRVRDGGVTRYTAAAGAAIAAGPVWSWCAGSRLAAFDAGRRASDRGWFGGEGRGSRGERSGRGSGPAPTHARADAAGGALAIDGTRLYVAGDGFAALRPARRLAVSRGRRRCSAARCTRWRPPNGGVAIGGTPERRDGVARADLAAFDLRTGAVKAFAPQGRRPCRRAAHRSGACSTRAAPAGSPRSTRRRAPRCRSPQASAPVHALAPPATRCTSAARPARSAPCTTDGLGAVSLATGAVLPFAPALELRRRRADRVRRHAARRRLLRAAQLPGFAPTPGPSVDGRVLALREDGAGGLWAGGAFAGGNVAHFAADGTPLVDAPVTDGPVHALAVTGGTVHLGGQLHPPAGRAARERRPGRAGRRLRSGRSTRGPPGRSTPRSAAGRRTGARRRVRLDLGRDHRRSRGLRRPAGRSRSGHRHGRRGRSRASAADVDPQRPRGGGDRARQRIDPAAVALKTFLT